MQKNIIVPAGHRVAIMAPKPCYAYRVVDGVAVFLKEFHTRAAIAALDVEWELSLESEEDPSYRLVDVRGYENIDTRAVEIPLDLRTTPTLRDQVVEQISRYFAARAVDEGYETLEEAHDFDMQGEIDDLATSAEASFLAAFTPHQGRAANDTARGVPALPEVRPEAFKPPSAVIVPKPTLSEEELANN